MHTRSVFTARLALFRERTFASESPNSATSDTVKVAISRSAFLPKCVVNRFKITSYREAVAGAASSFFVASQELNHSRMLLLGRISLLDPMKTSAPPFEMISLAATDVSFPVQNEHGFPGCLRMLAIGMNPHNNWHYI